MAGWLIGIDIGGTFTDVTATNPDTGAVRVTKVSSMPADPSTAVIAGLQRLFETYPDIEPQGISFFAHGTTVATNALLELKGARAGLLITRGFRATYELRGGTRPTGSDLIDTFYRKPATLVPLKWTEEITERIGHDGSVLKVLDEADVRRAVRRLKAEGINSIAVCYLFSFMNPAHERRTAEIIHEEHPDCRVSLSSIVLPVIREYPRLSTTVLDAYVGPVTSTYLTRLSSRLRDAGLRTDQLFIMQSNGGLMRLDVAANYPNQTLLSGPAAGVLFGVSVAGLLGEDDIVTLDMGGTSTDIAVLAGKTFEESRQGKIGGQDIGTPMIDIRTLGAGGGTIAWIGADGLLKAGPQSAGADPGPACYGRGGHCATVTDADLIMGYLQPGAFAGGQVELDVELSRQAIQRNVAQPLGLDLEAAAQGIARVVNVNMEVGVRLSLMERGLDHRRFALMAFGGAGPVHAARVARDIGIPRVIVPPNPGITCAMGLLQTDVKHYYLRGRLAPLSALDPAELEEMFQGLEDRARREAQEEGFRAGQVVLQRQLDLRYPYQGYELTVNCPPPPVTPESKLEVRRAFDHRHEQVYGVSAPAEVPEVVNVRLVANIAVPKLRLPARAPSGTSPAAARIGSRPALFEEYSGYVDTAVYERSLLEPGNLVEGPAIIQQFDSTTVILPGQTAEVDVYGTLTITVEAGR